MKALSFGILGAVLSFLTLSTKIDTSNFYKVVPIDIIAEDEGAILVLGTTGTKQVVPISISKYDAVQIAATYGKVKVDTIFAGMLIYRTLEQLGCEVKGSFVLGIKESGGLLNLLEYTCGNKTFIMECRLSDAIVITHLANKSIWISKDIFKKISFELEDCGVSCTPL